MESAPCNLTLWRAAGVEVPPKLLAALANAGARVTCVGDPFMALAELCLAARSTNKPDPPTSARLVILYPEMLTDAAEFCTAADTYAPGIPRWQYGPAANPQLRAIVDEDVIQWSGGQTPIEQAPEVVVKPAAIRAAAERAASERAAPERAAPFPASRTAGPAPQLRLAGEGPVPPGA